MSCQACNERFGEEYRLLVHERDGGHKDLDLTFCDECAGEFLALDWVDER